METKTEATETKNPPVELEPQNFRIDSAGWVQKSDRNEVRYLENPEGDVWELKDGPSAGEQHFTLVAAMRETAKAGKRMPTKTEWEEVIEAGTFVAILAGHRNWYNGQYCAQGANGYYWSSTPFGTYAYNAFSAMALAVNRLP